MITIPPSKPQKWHKRFEWVKYANTLFRYYSRRGNYALRLELAKGYIASVDPRSHIVRLNPDFATAPLQYAHLVRSTPARMRDHIIASMKGYLAHEAAHVRFSSEKPAGMLGQIWNSIEDERIERLMSQAHPDLAGVFTHTGDIHLTRSWDQLQFTPLEGVLTWRWAHDHPTLNWQCNDPETWARVLPHVEAAWRESDPDMVEEHSRRILEELRLPEQTQAPEIMDGPLVTCPDPEPGQGGKGRGKRRKQKTDDKADDQNGGGGQGDEQADDDQQQGGGKSKGKSKADQDDEAAADNTTDSQDDAREDDDQSGASGGDDDQQANVGDERDDQNDDDDGEGSGEDADDDTSNGEEDGDEDDDGNDDYGSEGEGAGEDGGAGGAGVGYPGDEPAPPEVVPEEPDHIRAREILRDVEGHARDLAAALALPDAPNLRVSHESRGRFDYGRYATGAQRTYRFKNHQGKKEMPRITLLHDNSGSMGRQRIDAAQYHAVRATMMLQRACELARTPLNVIAFNSRHHIVTNATDDAEKARGNIGGITSTGGTNLAPALRTALTLTHASRKRHVIVIYCDGHLHTGDANACHKLVKETPNTFILPILIGPNTRRDHFDHAFGRALEVKNADELASKLKTWVSTNLHT